MAIPYATAVRPDTGLSNGTLGMWLFIASEVMFFGALFSAYVLLRTGSAEWPGGSGRLGLTLAVANTIVLTASSVTMVRGGRAALAGRRHPARVLLAVSAGLGLVFLAVKASEWSMHIAAGDLPSTDTFMAIYFTLTGVHALHVAGGVAWLAYLSATALRAEPEPGQFAARVRLTGLYWLFVETVWLILFVTVYLL
jgi:heme/copper-type cytochrome/quinol oxidase subunit 3